VDIKRLARSRPKWTIGTLLLFIGWSSVVLWLNTRPRIDNVPLGYIGKDPQYTTNYGYPWPYAYACRYSPTHGDFFPDRLFYPVLGLRLAGNAAVGILAVTVLTLISKYLLNRIVSTTKFGRVRTE